MRTRRFALLCIGVALALAPACAAQPPDPAEGAGEPTHTNPMLEQARLLSRQVAILEILTTLRVDANQAALMADAMSVINSAQVGTNQRIANLVGPNAQGINAFIVDLLEDAPAAFEPGARDFAEGLVFELAAIRAEYRDVVAAQYDRVYATLTQAQVNALETYEERAHKADLEGAEVTRGGSLATRVTNRVLSARELEPAVYQQQAEDLAVQIARSVVGDDPALEAVAAKVLALMEEARNAPEMNQAARDAFAARVSDELGLVPDEGPAEMGGIPRDSVTQEGFENLLRDPIALELIIQSYGLGNPAGGGQ